LGQGRDLAAGQDAGFAGGFSNGLRVHGIWV
jgi:hypothetical protein